MIPRLDRRASRGRKRDPLIAFGIVFGFLRFTGAIVFLLGGSKGFLQADHVFAWAQRIERFGFFAQFVFGVVCRLNGQTNAALYFVHLDYASFYFLPALEHALDFGDMIFAQLGNMNESIDIVL